MEPKNVVALLVLLAIGFGGGMIVGGMAKERSVQARIDVAIDQARRECDARLALAGNAGGDGPREGGTEASSAAPAEGAEGVKGASGREMVERMLQKKPAAPGAASEGSSPTAPAASPATPASPPPPEAKQDEPPFPRVLDISSESVGRDIRVRGTVKNHSNGPCRQAGVEVFARDSRGLTVGSRLVPTSPTDIDGYGTATFDTAFPADSGATNFSGQPSCR
jgi:hypothetical protein